MGDLRLRARVVLVAVDATGDGHVVWLQLDARGLYDRRLLAAHDLRLENRIISIQSLPTEADRTYVSVRRARADRLSTLGLRPILSLHYHRR